MNNFKCGCGSEQIEIHETIDRKHFCSCIDCGEMMTYNISTFAFNRDGKDYFYFPALKSFFAYIDTSLPDRYSVSRLDFTKTGTVKKRARPEHDERILEFVLPELKAA